MTTSLSLQLITCTVLAAALSFLTSPLQAHHASRFFNVNEPVWLQGNVVSFEAVNPHARLLLDVMEADGEVHQWIVEGPRLGRMDLLGVDKNFLAPGETIAICGFFPSQEFLDVERPADTSVSDRFVHGRVLVKAGNERWLWGPYGNLNTCIDPEEYRTINSGRLPVPDR